MASLECVTTILAAWHEAYPTRELSAETARVWASVFPEVSDEDFTRAGFLLLRQPDRKFFPTSGEMAGALKLVQPPEASAAEVLRSIARLGGFTERFEWQWPRVETVRARLGNAVATAYGHVGPHRLTSENPTTREIAERDFAEMLATERQCAPSLALPAGREHGRLSA